MIFDWGGFEDHVNSIEGILYTDRGDSELPNLFAKGILNTLLNQQGGTLSTMHFLDRGNYEWVYFEV